MQVRKIIHQQNYKQFWKVENVNYFATDLSNEAFRVHDSQDLYNCIRKYLAAEKEVKQDLNHGNCFYIVEDTL